RLLEIWVAKAFLRKDKTSLLSEKEDLLAEKGRKLLAGSEEQVNLMEVFGENLENSRRKVLILKPFKAYHAYGDMIHYYAVKNLMAFMISNPDTTFSIMSKKLKGDREKEWVNLGGQIMKKENLDKIRSDIGKGNLKTWKDIHNRYNDLWNNYPADKQKHAFSILCEISGSGHLTKPQWIKALRKALIIQRYICDQVYLSRKKDFDNPFRQTTFRNKEEMKAALGIVENNSFIVQIRKETADFEVLTNEIIERG
ncbi:MAG: DUF4954 family protein, partial [Bacteroidia bacterium]|nr:DUF4954 family protein [Bacteroidia bacterium]